MSGPAISVRGLSKRFGRKTVLDGLSLDVAPGEVVVLLGENGAGKSTLMRVLLGLVRPDGGTVEVVGVVPARRPDLVRTRVGYVPDRPDVYPWMTVAELFRFLRPHHARWSDAKAAAAVAALRVPLDVRFKDMSKGQGMKAMLCAALGQDPDVLLLDEPFSGLDPVVREDVLRGVIGALKDGGRAVLCATHELDAAARIADRVAVLAGGKLVRCGTVAEVVGSDGEPANAPARLQEVLAATMACAAGEGR
jgi:ABC-2 type transport system ATP-binding protein